jgi:hypothetical protein
LDKRLSYAFLIFSNLSQCDCSWFEFVGLLDTWDKRSWLSGNLLGSQLLSWDLLGSWFPSSLLGSGHFQSINYYKKCKWINHLTPTTNLIWYYGFTSTKKLIFWFNKLINIFIQYFLPIYSFTIDFSTHLISTHLLPATLFITIIIISKKSQFPKYHGFTSSSVNQLCWMSFPSFLFRIFLQTLLISYFFIFKYFSTIC